MKKPNKSQIIVASIDIIHYEYLLLNYLFIYIGCIIDLI